MEKLQLNVQGLDSVSAECVCLIAEILNQKRTTRQEYLLLLSIYYSIQSGSINISPAYVFGILLEFRSNKNRDIQILIQSLCLEN